MRLELYDVGIRVAVGAIDDPETYRRLRADRAALVVATSRDEINTNVAFTVRELSEEVPVLHRRFPTPWTSWRWPAARR